jgi:hypothetical protein
MTEDNNSVKLIEGSYQVLTRVVVRAFARRQVSTERAREPGLSRAQHPVHPHSRAAQHLPARQAVQGWSQSV